MPEPTDPPPAAPATDAAPPPQGEPSAWIAWGRLLRIPNLFTVPGDPLGGAMLALAAVGVLHWGRTVAAAGISLLLYAGGLILNDFFDYAQDLRERPARPLPSGQIGRATALVVGAALLVGGVAWGVEIGPDVGGLAGALALCALVYDAGGKRLRGLGPALMGACRGLSVALGAVASAGMEALAQPVVYVSVGMMTLYIMAVTLIAARESRQVRIGPRRWLPTVIAGVWVFVLILFGLPTTPPDWPDWFRRIALGPILSFGACAVLVASTSAANLAGRPEPRVVQKTIGMLIRNLLLLQAMMAAAAYWPGAVVGALLGATWPLAALAGRKFYGS